MPELAMPKAAKRRGRTHTSRVSPLDAIVLSTLSPGHIDMRRVESTQKRRISLVCPDCGTWVAVTHHRGTYLLKTVPHHTGKAGVADAIRCSSSNRLVDVDISADTWSRQYDEWAREERLAVDLTRHRRATVQTLKVARPQERPADRRAQWERAVPAARRADAARTVPADAIPTTRGRAVDGPAGALPAMAPQTAGDRRSVRALAAGTLRALADAAPDRSASDVLDEHLARAAYTHLATIWRRPLTPADQSKHTKLVAKVRAELPVPAPGESAAAYTARCNRPAFAA
ncbi:hypothetical protein [Streptomyces venezuelae]|uniref:hypothetical protein n=1 Tax=Streptomyces venezuelae TaxID=54571 RepID=UPI00090305F1|nr:hypothetical protein [Streptomyces venezuelae]APE26772.1 hypothetical protein vnz_37320 [Streptomyces venezuelae]